MIQVHISGRQTPLKSGLTAYPEMHCTQTLKGEQWKFHNALPYLRLIAVSVANFGIRDIACIFLQIAMKTMNGDLGIALTIMALKQYLW